MWDVSASGLVDHIRDVCDRLAREGFVALAPDLYQGAIADDPSEAERSMSALELPSVGADLASAIVALLSQEATRGTSVGCMGSAMGGELALYAAAHDPRIGAVVDCYGVHPELSLERCPDLGAIEACVLGVFAENDELVPPAAVAELETKLRAAGVEAHFNVHVGVGHAFLNESRPDAYDPASAREAWNDILSFLRASLA